MQKDKTLVVVFLAIIFAIAISIPCKYILVKNGLITMNMDNFTEYTSISEKNIIDKLNNKIGKIENSIENKVTNYFPFYNGLNTLYQNLNFKSNMLLYKDVPIKTNSDGEYIFYDKENKFYYLTNKYSEDELKERLSKQVNFFNTLSNRGIDINIYIPTRYEYTSLKDDNIGNYIPLFINSLNKKINTKVMNITSINEYKNYFYKTDHHWTIEGALNGYQDICSMLGVTPLDNLNIIINKERKYYGSLAKTALNDSIYDYITDIDITLDYDVTVNGSKADDLFKPRKLRLDRDYKYYDYYVQYFNGQYGNIIYDYHNDNKENLLIIGDSYLWQIDYLLASHFNETHVINLRYDEYKNNIFNLTKYMDDNNISKVLFLYDGGSTLFDQYNYNFEGRIK